MTWMTCFNLLHAVNCLQPWIFTVPTWKVLPGPQKNESVLFQSNHFSGAFAVYSSQVYPNSPFDESQGSRYLLRGFVSHESNDWYQKWPYLKGVHLFQTISVGYPAVSFRGFTLSPTIMEVEHGPLQDWFLSNKVVFRFHDYGRKGKSPHSARNQKKTTELQYPLISLQLDP